MRKHTPINKYKLKSKEAKEFLMRADQMSLFSLKKISVPGHIFNELLESITPSLRIDYKDQIPLHDKILVRL